MHCAVFIYEPKSRWTPETICVYIYYKLALYIYTRGYINIEDKKPIENNEI